MEKDFIKAIRNKNKVQLTFYSKEDEGTLQRTCAPMDYGPSRRTKDERDRYHLWDYDSDSQQHTLSLLPDQIVKIKVTNECFDPEEFVTWDTVKSPWFISRDWGDYS